MEYDPEDPDVKFKDTKLPNFEDTNRTYLQYMEAVGGKLVDPLYPDDVRVKATYMMETDETSSAGSVSTRLLRQKTASPPARQSLSILWPRCRVS